MGDRSAALKKYRMTVVDNGSGWSFTDPCNPGRNDTDLDQLKKVPGSTFEVAVTGTIQTQ